MRSNRKNKENQGITLIALIITVIVLLILIGVSINLVLKGDLFESTQKTVNGTNAKLNEQQTIMDELINEWDEIEKDSCLHNWRDGEILLQPTCTTTGKKQIVCEICGKVLEVEIPALGHNYENRVCTRCGEAEPGCENHTFGDWVITKNPTCVAEGSKKKTCTVCGVEEVETIPATGVHTYGEWKVTKQATCTAEGTKTKTCTGCGATQSQVIAKLGHNFVNGTCSVCGETLVIGADINYHEYVSSSGSTVSASYTSTKENRGSRHSNYDKNASNDTDATYSVINNSEIQWIVLGEENGQIKITTKNEVQPTSGGYTQYGPNNSSIKFIYFGGLEGYTNCIDELNKISAVYGKGKYADTTKFGTSGGRSFNMEDLGYENVSDSAYSGSQTLSTTVSKLGTSRAYWLASRYYTGSNETRCYYYVCIVNGNGDCGYSTTPNKSDCQLHVISNSTASNSWAYKANVRPVVYLKTDIQLTYDDSNGYTISE